MDNKPFQHGNSTAMSAFYLFIKFMFITHFSNKGIQRFLLDKNRTQQAKHKGYNSNKIKRDNKKLFRINDV